MAMACQTRTRLITDFVEGESPSIIRSASISARTSTARAKCSSDIGTIRGEVIFSTGESRGYRGPSLTPGRMQAEGKVRQQGA
jgi:hypothetical protein